MTRNQIIIRPGSTTIYRKQPLLRQSPSSKNGRIAEVAGGTTAECAAVWCCCPCTLVNLLVLAVYKLPAGLCRKALRRRRRRRLIKKGLIPLPLSENSSVHHHHECCGGGWEVAEEEVTVMVMEKEWIELEKEMWDKFYSSGFWRSNSHKEY